MGQGDINRQDAWSGGAPTIGVGTTSAPAAKGGLEADAPTPTDPDHFIGSFTLRSVPSALGVGTVLAPTGKGDVGDVFGAPDTAQVDQKAAGLAAFSTGAPTLGVGSVAAAARKGQEEDPQAWATGGVPLGVGVLPAVKPQGDITNVEQQTQGTIGQVVWQTGSATLGVGTVAPVTGRGDVTDPFAWQDTILYRTSWTYPVLSIDNYTQQHALTAGFFAPDLIQFKDNFTPGLSLTSGDMHLGLLTYTNWPAENFSQGQMTLTSGDMHLGLIIYSNYKPESYSQTGLTLFSGSLVVTTGYINYTNWPAENYTQTGLHLTGGSLA